MIESPSETFRRLYASEINFTVSTFWDSGYQWALGDELNGYVAKGRTDTFEQAVAALADAASAIYPDSEFARRAAA